LNAKQKGIADCKYYVPKHIAYDIKIAHKIVLYTFKMGTVRVQRPPRSGFFEKLLMKNYTHNFSIVAGLLRWIGLLTANDFVTP